MTTKKEMLTKAEWQAYAEFVTFTAKRRKLEQPRFSEVDFFAGAMCVFFWSERQTEIPATWIFNPMQGKPILVDK